LEEEYPQKGIAFRKWNPWRTFLIKLTFYSTLSYFTPFSFTFAQNQEKEKEQSVINFTKGKYH